MIKTINLSKTFSTRDVDTHALNGVDFSVEDGEFVAIMGPSGCGKSTLLNILGMLDSPSGGEYYFAGENVAVYNEKKRSHLRKQKIGFIFQNFNLIDELTVYENVELPLLYLKQTQKERQEKVQSVLEQLEMLHRRNHFPLQLSGGQQQRVAIARAVVANPSMILADEPTGNLDSYKGEDVMTLLTNLNEKGTTIIMVTHSQRDAEFSNRIVNLFDGKIVNERF
ncbi:MAG: ABC transporter ATP-binding protein [Bacteroidetes bacterium]|nr:ABC transporter ATP-binding protein [Bacteroidota bacterium]